MKKIAIIAAAFLGNVASVFSQGTLPMFWDMDGAVVPTGFEAWQGTTGNKTYSLSSLVNSLPYALRLDATNEYVTANWAGKADTVSFYLAGTSTTGTWSGEVTVDESTDGTAWTNIETYKDNIPNKATQYIVRVKPESKFVRIYYKAKASGFNLAVDDFSVRPAPPSENPEIQVWYNNTKQINGGQVNTGNDILIVFDIKNNGIKNDLTISELKLSGNQAQDFTVMNQLPMTISTGATDKVEIKLNATSEGTYSATLTLTSNDPDNGSYSLDFSTIKGSKASEPQAQPTNFSAEVKAFRMKGSFTKSDAEHYLMLVSVGTASDVPVDGEVYERGKYIGKSRVLLAGEENTNIDLDNVVANTTYQIRIFAYNGYGAFTNYLTQSPLETSVTTPGLNPDNYYATISTSKPTFVSDLYDLINPHRRVYYSNYASYIIENFEARDTTNNQKVLEGFYSGFPYVYEPPFSHAEMTREHCYPQSYMTKVSDNDPQYSDLHLLYTVHQDKVNAVRRNYPLDEVTEVSTSFYGGKFGRNAKGEFCYEPRDFAKGIAARANFYACAAYNTSEFPFTLPTSNMLVNELQYQEILKKWHRDFPPSEWEIARHEYIAQTDVQGNRNPFIDSPQWVCYIDFSLMKHDPTGLSCTLDSIPGSVKSVKRYDINLAPNPTNAQFSVDLGAFGGQEVSIYVVDYFERTVLEAKTSESTILMNAEHLSSGTYLVLARTADGKTAVSTLLKP